MNISISPADIEQDSSKSLVTGGYYDLTMLSRHEYDVIVSVLRAAWNGKYPKGLESIGLINESFPIKYKPNYILYEIVVLKYAQSQNPIDNYAVAVAYQNKGAAFCHQTVEYYEKCLKNATPSDWEKIRAAYFSANEPYLDHSLCKAYEKVYDFETALKYAKRVEDFGDINVDHIGEILLKIDVNQAVDYYKNTLQTRFLNDNMRKFIISELKNAQIKAEKGYKFKPRPYKITENDIESERQKREMAEKILSTFTLKPHFFDRFKRLDFVK